MEFAVAREKNNIALKSTFWGLRNRFLAIIQTHETATAWNARGYLWFLIRA